MIVSRDSEDSAPAEYPPDQPEADAVDDDDADKYGAEEIELEEALIKEEAALKADEDEEMAGADDTAGGAAEGEPEDDDSDAGSEDLEAESSGSEDEEGEDEEGEGEGEGEGDEDMEMGDDENKGEEAGAKPMEQQHEVMVH